jgi:cell division protein FtsQ
MARRAPTPVPKPALPADVRLMNAVSRLLFVLFGFGLLVGALFWLARAPWFDIRAIQLEGELERNSVATIRANATPRLAGNFFSIDLQRTQAAFESVPWVRKAVVRRVWPNRLVVRLEEHRAAALWQGEEGNDRLVNAQGEVFEANLGDVEDDKLPTFAGPDGRAPEMLAMYRRLQPALQPLQATVDTLQLSKRGSWRVALDNGAGVEIGRGSEAELQARTERFARTLTQVTGRYRQPLLYADLRHTDGYAVRLQGVTTTETPAAGKKTFVR